MYVIDNPHFEDGELFNPPKNPLFQKYLECKYGLDYQCMYCSKCPLGTHFKLLDDEDKSLYEVYKQEFDSYCNSHGGLQSLVFDLHLERMEEMIE